MGMMSNRNECEACGTPEPTGSTAPTTQSREAELAKEVVKHRGEYPKEASDRWFTGTSTVADIVELILWELSDAMLCSEPDAPKNGQSVDSWHASACALRSYAMMLRLKDVIEATPTPATKGEALPNPADALRKGAELALEAAAKVAHKEGATDSSEGGNLARWDACNNVETAIRALSVDTIIAGATK